MTLEELLKNLQEHEEYLFDNFHGLYEPELTDDRRFDYLDAKIDHLEWAVLQLITYILDKKI